MKRPQSSKLTTAMHQFDHYGWGVTVQNWVSRFYPKSDEFYMKLKFDCPDCK